MSIQISHPSNKSIQISALLHDRLRGKEWFMEDLIWLNFSFSSNVFQRVPRAIGLKQTNILFEDLENKPTFCAPKVSFSASNVINHSEICIPLFPVRLSHAPAVPESKHISCTINSTKLYWVATSISHIIMFSFPLWIFHQ